MQTKRALLTSVVTGIVATYQLAASAGPAEKPKFAAEKCFGVAKAGKNDCAAKGHACQAQGTRDGDGKEWIYVPAGTCERLVGGSLTAKS